MTELAPTPGGSQLRDHCRSNGTYSTKHMLLVGHSTVMLFLGFSGILRGIRWLCFLFGLLLLTVAALLAGKIPFLGGKRITRRLISCNLYVEVEYDAELQGLTLATVACIRCRVDGGLSSIEQGQVELVEPRRDVLLEAEMWW